MANPTVYHIPVCPFSQRLEILLALKGRRAAVDFRVVDITQPRPAWLLEKTRGSTALPVLETAEGQIVKESLVILEYLEAVFSVPRVAQRDPYPRAVERMLTALEGPFTAHGYGFLLNQLPERYDELRDGLLLSFAALDAFLREHASTGPFLFDTFGWAEVVFTPIFMRFWFLDYYEAFELPDEHAYARVRAWRDACLAHPSAQQVTREQIVKLYYDYAKGAGNGALVPGRTRSSFAFEPHWRDRPWPPRDKYRHSATDAELGL
jgi:glutathione S-transferase